MLDTSDVVIALATLLGPIFAIQVEKWRERRRDDLDGKLRLFKTLMATRALRLSSEHIAALNLIDLQFYEQKTRRYASVRAAWKAYFDTLCNANRDEPAVNQRSQQDQLVDLLFEMARALGFHDIDRTLIRRQAYSPIGRQQHEDDEEDLRHGLAEIVRGKNSLRVSLQNAEIADPNAAQ